VVATTGEIETGNQLQMRQTHQTPRREDRMSVANTVALANATGSY
jgi:hypothetical protein